MSQDMQTEIRERQAMECASNNLLSALWKHHRPIMYARFKSGKAEGPPSREVQPDKYEKERNAPYSPAIADRIISLVGDYFELSHGEIIGDDRHAYFVDARATVSWIMKSRGWSTSQIGRCLKKDRSSVTSQFQMIEKYRNRNSLVGECISAYELMLKLGGMPAPRKQVIG